MSEQRKPYKWVCEECKSDNVSSSGSASWDIDSQTWVLGDMYDDDWCSDCQTETRLETVDLEETK